MSARSTQPPSLAPKLAFHARCPTLSATAHHHPSSGGGGDRKIAFEFLGV